MPAGLCWELWAASCLRYHSLCPLQTLLLNFVFGLYADGACLSTGCDSAGAWIVCCCYESEVACSAQTKLEVDGVMLLPWRIQAANVHWNECKWTT